MEPKRTLHSGNLVRGVHAVDRKLFMEKYYGTCFVREDILLRDGVHKIDGRKKNELENSVGRLQKFQSKISYRSRGAFYKEASRCFSESFQILKIEDKEENFSFMGKENHNIIKKWLK